jgi:antitoxin component of MazEF toxin-antitoxin module
MIRKLQKVGKSRALIISKELAGLIGLGEDEEVTVEVFGNTIQIRPASQASNDIPERERWLHTPGIRRQLDRALSWDAEHPVKVTNFEAFDEHLQRQRRGKQ